MVFGTIPARHRTGILNTALGLMLTAFCVLRPATAGDNTETSAAQARTRVTAFGATGDGKTDDTAAIQQAVDAQIGEIRFPRGVFRLSKTITIDLDRIGPTSLIADGPARVVMTGPGPAFRFVGTHQGTAAPETVHENVWQNQRTPMISGLEIVGDHPQACGIEASGTMQLTITRLVVRRALHGIHLVKRNRNVIISSCHLYDNIGAGIYYDNVNLHQSNIIGSHVSYNDGGGIVIRGGDVRNVHIGTCDIEGNMGTEHSDPTANVLIDATGGSIGEVAITGCTIQHAHGFTDSANIRINGDSTVRSFTDETRHGNITIADNVLSDVQVNLDVRNTRGVTISGNTIWKGFAHNLKVDNCASIVVSGNVFDRNPRYHAGKAGAARHALLFTNSDGCSFSGNHIVGVDAAPAAVTVRDCRHFNITNCTILDSGPCALLLQDVSHSRVSGCLIRHSSEDSQDAVSLKLTGGTGNLLTGNLWGNTAQIDESAIHRTKNPQSR